MLTPYPVFNIIMLPTPKSPKPFLFQAFPTEFNDSFHFFRAQFIRRPAHFLHIMALIGRRCLLVFGKCSLRISSGTLVILVETFHGFPIPSRQVQGYYVRLFCDNVSSFICHPTSRHCTNCLLTS